MNTATELRPFIENDEITGGVARNKNTGQTGKWIKECSDYFEPPSWGIRVFYDDSHFRPNPHQMSFDFFFENFERVSGQEVGARIEPAKQALLLNAKWERTEDSAILMCGTTQIARIVSSWGTSRFHAYLANPDRGEPFNNLDSAVAWVESKLTENK